MKNQIKIQNIIKPFKKQIIVSSDKSLSIRCILLSSIAIGRSKIFNLLNSEDVNNTLRAVKKIGVSYIKKKNYLEINGVGINGFKIKKNTVLNAGNSGTLARCIIGLCSASKNKFKLIGDKSLSKRDFSRVIKPLNLFGVNQVNVEYFLDPLPYWTIQVVVTLLGHMLSVFLAHDLAVKLFGHEQSDKTQYIFLLITVVLTLQALFVLSVP